MMRLRCYCDTGAINAEVRIVKHYADDYKDNIFIDRHMTHSAKNMLYIDTRHVRIQLITIHMGKWKAGTVVKACQINFSVNSVQCVRNVHIQIIRY